MQGNNFSQRNTIPEIDDANTAATQRIGMHYEEKMKERYEKYKKLEALKQAQESPVVRPTEVRSRARKLPPLVFQAQYVLSHIPVAIVAVVVGLMTLLIHGFRLNVAPDVFGDEGTYLMIGTNLARGLGLEVNKSGGVFLWHPPAYYLVEAAYIKLTGLTYADPLAALLSVRYLNIFFSASTAVLLMLFGRKLHSYKAGLIMAMLFLMDPYVQRINRHTMLETLAMMCVLLGLYIFFTHQPHLTPWQRLGAGGVFGLAMLTKEPMFLELCALMVYVVWFKRSQLGDLGWVTAIAFAVYLPYPIWAVAAGQGNNYLSYKLFGTGRLISFITGSRPPSPPNGNYLVIEKSISFLDNLWTLLTQYGTSYLLIALAAIFTAILIFRFRQLTTARYLIILSIFSFGIGLGVGKVDDQYFYYLIVPSIIVVGYILASLLETVFSHPSKKTLILQGSRPLFSQSSIGFRITWKPLLIAFVVILLFNGYLWTKNYAVGSDDAAIKVIEYVKAHIPREASIWASNDAIYWFLSPWYNVHFEAEPPEQQKLDKHIQYYIMSSKDALGGYNGVTPQFYNVIIRSSRLLFEQDGSSFGKMGVYQLTLKSTLTLTSTDSSVPKHFHMIEMQMGYIPIISRITVIDARKDIISL